MTSDRDREILAETERQLRREVRDLARRFETTQGAQRRLLPMWITRAATSTPAMVLLLLLFAGSIVLGLGLAIPVIGALAAISIWFRMRREGDA